MAVYVRLGWLTYVRRPSTTKKIKQKYKNVIVSCKTQAMKRKYMAYLSMSEYDQQAKIIIIDVYIVKPE